MRQEAENYPLANYCTLPERTFSDPEGAQLKAWQLTLNPSRPSYSFPAELPDSFFGVVWNGSVDGVATDECDADYRFFRIGSSSTIRLTDDSPSAEIAVIGIVGTTDPNFPPGLEDRSSVYLEFPPTNAEPLTATILVLDLNDSSQAISADDWVRPCYVLTTQGGPRPRFFTGKKPQTESELAEEGAVLVFVGVPGPGSLSFEYGTDSTQTIAIVCDFAIPGDANRIDLCTWRCPGKI